MSNGSYIIRDRKKTAVFLNEFREEIKPFAENYNKVVKILDKEIEPKVKTEVKKDTVSL